VIALNPGLPDPHNNLGIALLAKGQIDEAIACHRRALALRPDFPAALYNLGAALQNKGLLDEAIATYRQAIALQPNYSEAHNNLGNVLRDNGRLDDAIAAYRRAIALRPKWALAHGNLGRVLKDKGQLNEAIAAHRQAIALDPNSSEAHYNLGNALASLGRPDEAIAIYRVAIALKPDLAQVHINLANVFAERGQHDEAIAALQQAIRFKPGDADALYNLGNALRERGRPDDALAAYRLAIINRPGHASTYGNMGAALKDMGRVDDAIAASRHAVALSPDAAPAHSNLVYLLHFSPDYDTKAVYEEASHWNQKHAAPLTHLIRPHPNDRDLNRRLRIGYISPDFRDHCQSLFTMPLLSAHDPGQVEICCYSDVVCPDELTRQLRGLAQHWTDVNGKSDDEVADLIRRDAIDILVDLTMHMARNRLLVFARKPAPVQVSWLAYPGSTGLSAIDCRLSDPYLDPPGADESICSEKTVRLPNTFWCYDPQIGRELPISTLPAMGGNVITFGCLNNFCKTNDAILNLWANMLREIRGSRLLLLAHEGSHRQRTMHRLGQVGIDPSRIEFVSPRPRREYLELYHRIDIGLDSFPYNGHTTSLDSFWMGVPVVTLMGETAVSRAGWCQLSNLRLPELAARTPEQFVEIAVALAGDLPRLQALRASLRQRMENSPLMDAPKFAREMEAAYRSIWRTWCESADVCNE
jgi:predicted O-linked N-acetylglucosamine transferase (SPINDLY family)